jgi:hypothetical protein
MKSKFITLKLGIKNNKVDGLLISLSKREYYPTYKHTK